MSSLWLLLAVLGAASPGPRDELVLSPLIVQNAVLFVSNNVTAGGAGGGLGLQLLYRERYLAQADLSVLWGLGNTMTTRFAFGVQRDDTWAPAGWLTMAILWGDRIETLTGDGRRPRTPSWSTGVRASPLRFVGESGAISVLEPGVATDFGGGLWIEFTLAQASLRF